MNADKIASNENTALDERSQIVETIRAIDDFYRQADELSSNRVAHGTSDCALRYRVYALVNEDVATQKQLCELDSLRCCGTRLSSAWSTKRSRAARRHALHSTCLSDWLRRKQYEAHIQAVLAAEHEAVAIFTDEEQRQLTSAMKRYINALNENLRLSPSTRDARFPCLFWPLFSPKGFPHVSRYVQTFLHQRPHSVHAAHHRHDDLTRATTIVDGFFVSNYAGKQRSPP